MDHLFIAEFGADDTIVPIDEAVRRHVAALRLRDGELVRVLNGRGLVGQCIVTRRGSDVLLNVIARDVHPKPTPLTLVMSNLDNRDRFEFALEKATELGATCFVPLLADHCQHKRVNLDRLRAKAVAAATQCGVAWLPEITQPTSIEGVEWGSVVIVGDDRGARPASDVLTQRVTVIVGPEGDFSERETEIINSLPHTLRWAIGSTRLRAETAAIALVGAVIALR